MDIYILPVEIAPEKGFPYPFIAYGTIEFLEVAALKGCTDYLREPWGRKELLFRVQKAVSGFIRKKPGDELEWKLLGRQLAYGDKTIRLSFPEALIFKVFIAHTEELVNRETLFYTLWGKLPTDKSRVIDVYISSLRRKIKYLKDNPDYNAIMPVRGYGYFFTG